MDFHGPSQLVIDEELIWTKLGQYFFHATISEVN